MEIALQSFSNAKASGLTLSDSVFNAEYRESVVHQVVVASLANRRAGTKAQKSRADVSGGGRKPFRQKGTGRARAGTTRGPIWRGGGVTFAAKPRDFSQKVNKKTYVCALKSILSELIRTDRLIVVDDLVVSSAKTKDLVNQLGTLGLDDVYIITHALGESLKLAAGNLHWVGLSNADSVNVVSLMSYKKVLMTAEAVKKIEERLQ